MARQKKINTVDSKENHEVTMNTTLELESIQQEIDKARQELEATKVQIEEKKKELQSNPRREHDEQEIAISQKHVNMQVDKGALKEKIEKQKAYDSIKVTGKFINRRSPGNSVKLTYIKYEDDPVKWYHLEDGKVYTLPRGFVDQIRDYYHTPQFTQKQGLMNPDAPSSAIHEVDTSNKKYDFVPINF
jgi:hypothetical protein